MSKLNYSILLISLLFSCSLSKQTSTHLEEEYKYFLEIKKISSELFKEKGFFQVNKFLDSLYVNSEIDYISSYAKILNVSYVKDSELKQARLDGLIHSKDYSAGSPHVKYLIKSSYNSIYKERSEYNLLLENILNSIEFIEPYEDIYHKELAEAYENSALIASHFLNEKENSNSFRNKALGIALRHKDIDLALAINYNQNVPLHTYNDDLQEIANLRIGKPDYNDSLAEIHPIIVKNAYQILKHTNQIIDTLKEEIDTSRNNYLVYIQLRHAYSKLKLFAKVEMLDREIERLSNEGVIDEYQKMLYFLEAVKDDIDSKKKKGVKGSLQGLENYFKSVRSNYNLYDLYTSWSTYSAFQKKENEQLYYIGMSYYYFRKHLDNTNNITKHDLNSMIRLVRKAKNIIEAKPYLKNHLGYAIAEEMVFLDSMKFKQLKEESDAHKSQINHLTRKQILHTENQLDIERSRAKTISTLLVMSLVCLFLFGQFAFLLKNKNKIINAQNQEIELITNMVPIGLCKIDRDYNIMWDNHAFKSCFQEPNRININKEDFKYQIISLIKENFNSFEYEGATQFEVGITDDFKIKDSFEESLKWLKFYFIPIKKKDKIAEVILLLDDRTKEKQDQVLILEKNEELNAFAHVVSHDLKSPLRAVKSLLRWIKADVKDDLKENTNEYFEELDNRVNNMQLLIDGILMYSKIDKEEVKESVDTRELIRYVSNFIQRPDNFQLSLNGDFPILYMSFYKMHQVFQNLIDNAIKHNDKEFCKIDITSIEDEDFYIFKIKDNGPGIPETKYDKIFGMFQSYNKSAKSTGVGLSIVKKITEQYGGKAIVESDLGNSTTFTITFNKNLVTNE